MNPAIIELGFHGIILPMAAPENSRTTCPQCSHTRAKSTERCMIVRLGEGRAWAYCYHCEWSVEV